MEKGFIREVMEGGIMESGSRIKWTERDCLLGLIRGAMRASMWMTRNRGLVCLCGQMDGGMKEGGLMGNSTGKGFL